jgi:hypothetical protein
VAAKDKNPMPRFADIEASHILYVRSHYKPYATIASEYVRVRPSGDTAGIGASGATLTFTFPIYGHFTSDIALHLRFGAVGSAALFTSADATSSSAAGPYLYRWCHYPGLRAVGIAQFRSDQVIVDEYTSDDAVLNSKFFVDADHQAAWDRCHGQQEVREATYLANNCTGVFAYADGPQTPKFYQPSFDVFVPLQFDFCKDASKALFNDMISNTQRTITIEIPPIDKLLRASYSTTTAQVLGQPPIFGQTDLTTLPTGALQNNVLPLEASLYVNNLFVSPEIHAVFAARLGETLIRVHRRQVVPLSSANDSFLLDQLKFPAEYLMVGVRNRTNATSFERWHMMGTPRVRNPVAASATNYYDALYVPAMVWNSTVNAVELIVRQAVESSTLDSFTATLGVTAHGGIQIFDPSIPAPFYNSYMPQRYKENSFINAPRDTSAFLVNFCLYPGKHNASGYYNLSAGRELYLVWSLLSNAPATAEMVVSMGALNFLVRRGDSLALKYAI